MALPTRSIARSVVSVARSRGIQTSSVTRAGEAIQQPQQNSTTTPEKQQNHTDGHQAGPLLQNEPATASPLLKGVAKLMGYNSRASTAIRSTNHYFNRCSEQDRIDADFWYRECGLPNSFQTWFQITNLHVWMLTVRFRALPSPLGRYFCQEIVNHLFVDAEYRMQTTYEINQGRLVKAYLRDMLGQHRGGILAYDEAIMAPDTALAAALWRNMFGAAWGQGTGGILDKAPTGKDYPTPSITQSDKGLPQPPSDNLAAELSREEKAAKAESTDDVIARETQFAVTLAKLVDYVRSDLHRLDQLPDDVIARGQTSKDQAAPAVQFRLLSATTPTGNNARLEAEK